MPACNASNIPPNTHLSPTRAQGFRQTVACLCFWSFGKPLTPEQELLSACSLCERIALRVCMAELWCRRHQLAFEWIGSVLAVTVGFVGGCWLAILGGLALSRHLLHLSTY